MVYRIWDLIYTALADEKINIRLGRFEIPYGLEHDIDTSSHLLDYMSLRNLGPEPDWGGAINGVLPHWQYEIGLSRGTGNEYTQRNDPNIVSVRISTPPEDHWCRRGAHVASRLQNRGDRSRVVCQRVWPLIPEGGF